VPDTTVRSVCGFCATGCSLDLHLRDGTPVVLTPTSDYPVNHGTACPKGWESLTPLRARDRLTSPLLRGEDGRLHPVDWSTALDAFVSGVRGVTDRHGPEAMAFLSTGQIPTEEMALLGALTKFGMGLVHGDANTRQCMATSVVAHKECFGFDAPPFTYSDLEESDTVVLVGSNLAIAHPIMWERLMRNPRGPEIVVIDPRVTETAMAATLHVPVEPGGDLVLLYGIARTLIGRGWIDEDFIREHTAGFDAFAAHVEKYGPEEVTAATGIQPEELDRIADAFRPGRRVSLWWTMGVNQSHQAVRTAQAIIALALMTGNIGQPGTGANSITGQCNAMGSRLFSNTSSLMGGRDFANAEHRAEVASILDLPVERIPDRNSWAYDQIIERISTGEIRGLWVIATNSAHSWVNQSDLHELFRRLDFLVVQDMYGTTETAQRADLVLAAAGWGEKDGTFINAERRVGVVRKVATAPGEALADFAIFRLIADAWGCGDLFSSWSSPAAAFEHLERLSAGRPCDITGIAGYDAIEAAGGIQWPWPAAEDGSPLTPTARDVERRLFADGRFFHPDGRARFVCDEPRPVAERPSARFPLALLTGRGTSAQWHTGTRTSKSSVLRALAPAGSVVEIHPDDANARGIGNGAHVEVRSARGAIRATALVTPTVRVGSVFVPMHAPDVNQLTFPSFDPHSRQPAYKDAAVEVARV
jgi:assimilatory nitrate reductase catalytic subunit